MTAVVNLTALAEARAKMTPGEYRYDQSGIVETLDRGINQTGSETEVFLAATSTRRPHEGDRMNDVESLFAAEANLRSAAVAYADRESSMAVEDKARARRDEAREQLRNAAKRYAEAVKAITSPLEDA